MKFIKYGIFILLALVILVAGASYFYLQSLKPQFSGEVNMPNISQEVTVHYDEYGVPHIYGNSQEDVYRTLGYVHAQDRLWQMDLYCAGSVPVV